MTLSRIVELLRRHLLAVTAVLILAAGTAYDMKSAPRVYSERAALVFGLVNPRTHPHSSSSLGRSLIITETTLAEDQMTPAGQRLVRDAGGTAQFELVPLNLSNMQYPNYSEPYATLTTTSLSPAAAGRTFRVVTRVLGQRLAAVQSGVSRRSRIRVYLAGNTGVLAQQGSSTRGFAGLALLTIVAVGMVVNFLDRRRDRMGTFRSRPFRLRQ